MRDVKLPLHIFGPADRLSKSRSEISHVPSFNERERIRDKDRKITLFKNLIHTQRTAQRSW